MSPRGDRPSPTLAHVALRARVSKATASLALRGEQGPSAETVARVRQAATELGYRTKVGASALRAGLGSTVAVVLDPTTMDRRLQVDTFWAKFVNAIVTACSTEGIPVMLVAGDDAQELKGHAVDAVLFMSDDSTISEFEALGFGLPLVKIEMGSAFDDRLTTTLRLDIDGCVREVMDQLTSAGCKKPAVIYGRERQLLNQVELSYRAWCADVGIEPVVIENQDPHDDKRCIAETLALIGDGVDGFFTYMTEPANVVRAALLANKSVPDDIALVAQGERTSIPFFDCELSNVSFHGTESGAIAAKALVDAFSGTPDVEVDLPYTFTPRASSRA